MSDRRQVIVYRARLSDVDDPVLYAAEPLYRFEQSELGKWVMANAIPESVVWNTYIDQNTYGYQVIVKAEFQGSKITEYLLRWS